MSVSPSVGGAWPPGSHTISAGPQIHYQTTLPSSAILTEEETWTTSRSLLSIYKVTNRPQAQATTAATN